MISVPEGVVVEKFKSLVIDRRLDYFAHKYHIRHRPIVFSITSFALLEVGIDF